MIIDSEYDHEGTPGRACLDCNSAWPTTEPDDDPCHHADDCKWAVLPQGDK